MVEDEDEDEDEKVIPRTASGGRGQKFESMVSKTLFKADF